MISKFLLSFFQQSFHLVSNFLITLAITISVSIILIVPFIDDHDEVSADEWLSNYETGSVSKLHIESLVACQNKIIVRL